MTGVDSVAYDSDYEPYLVDISPIKLDSDVKKIIIQKLRAEGYNDFQITKGLEEIAAQVMDAEIESGHPDSLIRDVAGNPNLSLKEKEQIYGWAQGAKSPYFRLGILKKALTFDSDNPVYSRQDRKAYSLPLGMNIVTLQDIETRENFNIDDSQDPIKIQVD